jgi:hypothetical protein
MRKCCLIHLKNNSTCQRFLYSAAIVKGGKVGLLVRNASVLPESTSLNRIHLIADRAGCPVGRSRIHAPSIHVALAKRDEKRADPMQLVQPAKPR